MIDILLATYNSERYLQEQIDSILSQTYTDWRLIIRDDGSTDKTIDIIKEYTEKYDNIHLVMDDRKCQSAQLNFMQLLNYATSDYAMFCDHDDYWLKEKIEVSLNHLKLRESQVGKDVPIVCFTDYYVVDRNLKLNEKRNNNKQRIKKSYLNLNRMLVQNYITGCTMIFNKALYSKIGDVKSEVLMHDWWLGLYASCFGEILYLDKPTLYYRQHGNNSVGDVNYKSLNYIRKKLKHSNVKNIYIKHFEQAKLFAEMYGLDMDTEKLTIINRFIEIQNSNKIKKIYLTLKYSYIKNTFIRILGQIYFV